MSKKWKVKYTFSGGYCWECAGHRKAMGADTTRNDWETVTISVFPGEHQAAVLAFIPRLAEALGIKVLDYAPRKNPRNTAIGMAIATTTYQMSDIEAEFFALGPREETWPDAMRWLAWEIGTIALEAGTVHQGARRSDIRDVVIHAETKVIEAFTGGLYDWNHGADEAWVLSRAPFEAL